MKAIFIYVILVTIQSFGQESNMKSCLVANLGAGLEIKNLDSVIYNLNYSETYVSYELNGSSTGNEKFTVYSRNKNSNEYLGFYISHEVNTAPLEYNNQWRITGADFFKFDGKRMVSTENSALTAGESESVYKRKGKDDSTGGYHGDEQVTSINFFIDNVRLLPEKLRNDFDLLGCLEFSYSQISTTHTTSTDHVVELDHPIEAVRYKRTEFKNFGYESNIRYEWQMLIDDFEHVFLNLVSIDKFMGDYGENDFLLIYKFREDGSFVLETNGTWMKQYHSINNTAVTVQSKSNIQNKVAVQYLRDVPAYHKYYRNLNPNMNLKADIGDVWEGTTTIQFYKN